MTYQVGIQTSGGYFDAEFQNRADLETMVSMVASGAQVRHGWSISIADRKNHGSLSAQGQSIIGMRVAVGALLDALENMPKRSRDVTVNYDVVVPVHIAVGGAHSLTDAEDFVRGAVEQALYVHDAACRDNGYDTTFMYNGEAVQIGSAKEY